MYGVEWVLRSSEPRVKGWMGWTGSILVVKQEGKVDGGGVGLVQL